MSAGDGKPEIHPPLPKKDLVESLGTSPNAATAEKLLSDAHTAKLSTPVSAGPITANTFGMVSLTNKADLLTNSHVEHKAIQTGNSASDFAVNFLDGGVRNLANIGKETLKSVANPLGLVSDIGTAGKTIVANPTAVKDMAADFGSSLIGGKGAGEAGSSWGNLTTTVGMFFVGGKNAVQRAERTAVEGAGSIEAKVAQTTKILGSAEVGTAKATESLAARLGTGNAAEVGNVTRTLPNRLDGLKPPVLREPVIKAPVAEPVIKAPRPEPVLKAPAPEPVLKAPTPEPVLKAPTPEPIFRKETVFKAPEPVIKEPVVRTPEPIKPANNPLDDARLRPAAEPVKPGNSPLDDARLRPTAEPVKPGNSPLDDAKLKPAAEPVKPGNNPLDDAKLKPAAEPVKPGKNPLDDAKLKPVAEPVKPGNNPLDDLKPKPTVEPVKPGTNPIDDVKVRTPGEPVKPGPNPLDDFKPNKPQTVEPKPLRPGEPVVAPRDTVPAAPRETNPVVPRDNAPPTPDKPANFKPTETVVNPAASLSPKDAPRVVPPAEQPQIQSLVKELDKLPTTVPGVTDARTKLSVFNNTPTPENYRNLSDTLKTLANNNPAVHEQVQVALETARQSVLAHAVADTTKSLESLLSSASSRVSNLPADVQGKAEGILQQMRSASQSMLGAELASGQRGALEQLKSHTQELGQLLNSSKAAQSEIENALLKLTNAQKELMAANYLVRTGDTFAGQTADFLKNYWRNILGSAVVAGDLKNLLSGTQQGIEAEAKKLADAQAEKAQEVQPNPKAANADEPQRSGALFLNSKEPPLGKPAAEHDTREVIRKQNLSMYGIDVDYTYYQRGPGHVVVDERPVQQQQAAQRPGFRTPGNEQDKPSAPKFDYTKTRMPATRLAAVDNPYTAAASGFRPGGAKNAAAGRGGASGASAGNNDPSHASNLMSKNYAFVVGPTAAQSRYGGPATGSEAAEKQNPDRGTGGGAATAVATHSPSMVAASSNPVQVQSTDEES